MGFFDKLKEMGRAVTGGGAKVYFDAEAPSVSAPFTVRVKAVVADADLKIDAVYVLVRGREEVRVGGETVARRLRERAIDIASDGRLDGIVDSEDTCELRVDLAGPRELEAGQEYEWEGQITLPPGSLPSYNGRKADHKWRFQAGLDAFGNDPDSGWIEVQVR